MSTGNRIGKKTMISRLVLLTLIGIYLFSFIMYGNTQQNVSVWVYISFLPTYVICIYELVKERLDVSLNKMHWYFVFIFLVLSPISQIRSGYCPWRFTWVEELIYQANVLVFLWCIVYAYSYKKNTKIQIRSRKNVYESTKDSASTKPRKGIYLNNSKRIFLLLISGMALLLMIRVYGFSNLFIRGSEGFGDNTFGIMFDYLLRSIPVINCAIFILDRKQNGHATIIEIVILFVCSFILNSPIALSRYWSGVVYLGLFVCLIPRKWIMNKRFDFLVLIVLLIVFPAFSIFKNYSLQEALLRQQHIDIMTVYNSVDFDAYSLLCRIIQYTQENGFTWGAQLRSVIFFFVPRSIWSIKGVPTGQLVATWLNSFYTNVSSPLMGEGYIDFGIVGLLIYSVLFGKILKKYDKTFAQSENNQKGNKVLYMDLISPFLLGFTVFIMRGALQSVFLRIMGFFLYLMILFMVENVIASLSSKTSKR